MTRTKMPKSQTPWVYKAIFFLFGLILIWRIVSIGISDYYASDNSVGSSATALAWNSSNSQALYSTGLSQLALNHNSFESYLAKSMTNNVSDSRGLVLLAEQWAEQGNTEKADKAMRLLGRLYPADTRVNIIVSSYFYNNGNITEAFRHWSQTLTRSRHYDATLFEFIYPQLDNAELRTVVLEAAKASPNWWPRFFAYATKQSKNNTIEIVDALYAARLESSTAIKPNMRRQYLNYLMGIEKWQKSYTVWLSGLSQKERSYLGYLYDGGFENDFSHYGFYWQAYKNKAAKIDRVRSTSMGSTSGNKALKVTFLNKPEPFHHVRQKILLRPGNYLFKGKVKKEGLKSNRGLSWRITCGRNQVLGKSARFNGMEHWRSFEVEFRVPRKNCDIQEIWLVTNAKNKSDYKIKGSIWFDDLSIVTKH